jgi:hypothetical protein
MAAKDPAGKRGQDNQRYPVARASGMDQGLNASNRDARRYQLYGVRDHDQIGIRSDLSGLQQFTFLLAVSTAAYDIPFQRRNSRWNGTAAGTSQDGSRNA